MLRRELHVRGRGVTKDTAESSELGDAVEMDEVGWAWSLEEGEFSCFSKVIGLGGFLGKQRVFKVQPWKKASDPAKEPGPSKYRLWVKS